MCVSVCACVHVCARACVCVCVCVWGGKQAICDHVQLLTLAKSCNRFSFRLRNRSCSARRGEDGKCGVGVHSNSFGGGGGAWPANAPLGTSPGSDLRKDQKQYFFSLGHALKTLLVVVTKSVTI